MKENNPLLSIENNKNSNISISVGQIDELSCDNIRRNYNNVVMLEEEFSDRLEYSKDVLTKKLLPQQLQSDFEIVPTYFGNKIEYETKATTPDAYEKFPMKLTYTIKFKNKEEARKFRENGISELLKKAEELQQPVEIPNIIDMKELIGDFEDPVGYANKHGIEGIKLYICPRHLPPAQKYRIEVFNNNTSFCLKTSLRLKARYEDKVVLTNAESKDEPFDILISFTNIESNEENKHYKGKFNIKISLRNTYLNNCEYNKELIKFGFLMRDSNNHILINNDKEETNVFALDKCGSISYSEIDYNNFNNIINLIEKVIYISKVKRIDINYDLDYFLKSEELINLTYNEILGKKYIIHKKMFFNYDIPKDENELNFYKTNTSFKIISELGNITLFGKKIEFSHNELELNNCALVSVDENEDNYTLKISSSNIIFTPTQVK